MAITREQVHHIALLARLQLTADEEASFTEQLDNILGHFARLAELDTSSVDPTAQIVETETPFREDVVTNVPAVDALLANAPLRDGRFFKVPKIIE